MGVSTQRWVTPHPAAEKAAEALRAHLGDAVLESSVFRAEVTLVVDPARIVDACHFLKLDPDHAFDMLSDLTGIHFMDRDYEYEIVYHLYSFKNNCRLRLKTRLAETNHAPTLTGVWATADWQEREAYDLVGIVFDGHPDLRRILMPDDFEFHPLRKDFPLEGHGA
jgi:NADH-quinone oxidoreductase subunit C